MRNTYSLYEAKAKLSAIVKKVREGQSVIVTLRGEPVVEMRPVGGKDAGLEARMDRLAESGILVRSSHKPPVPNKIVRRPGALRRFLDERE